MRVVFFAVSLMMSFSLFSQTTEFTLDNGLKIVVKEDHRSPVAVSMIWYNVGSADEKGGHTGLSHALEHLMFKGTQQYPLGVFSKKIASLGGQENAFTNTDYTAYFEKLSVTHLPTALAMEADRMQNLLLNPEEFAKEIKVVQEERRLRTDDNPQALTLERFLAAAHVASPYHHPVIGWMTDLEQMTVEDAQKWYKRYYAPNNAVLVVVGDVEPEAVHQQAKQFFGALKPQALPTRKQHLEPKPLGKKTIVVQAPAQLPMLIMGYTVPTVKTAANEGYEPYALEILASILDVGDNGRLSKDLVRGQHIASSADAYYNLYARYQTQFMLYGTPSQNHTINELKQAFLSEISRLKKEIVPTSELQRIKTQIIAQKTFERDSIFSQAMELGMLETIGIGWQTAAQYIDRINAVTPEQLQKTAQTYFTEKALTEAELLPE